MLAIRARVAHIYAYTLHPPADILQPVLREYTVVDPQTFRLNGPRIIRRGQGIEVFVISEDILLRFIGCGPQVTILLEERKESRFSFAIMDIVDVVSLYNTLDVMHK